MNAVNLFAYGDGESVVAIGYCHYQLEGSDEEVNAYLNSRIATDHGQAAQVRIERPLTVIEFNSLARLDLGSLLRKMGASPDAAYIITHIVDGQPKIDEVVDATPQEVSLDYLDVYRTGHHFDFTRLIEDDYLDAVKLLWSQEKYVSALGKV